MKPSDWLMLAVLLILLVLLLMSADSFGQTHPVPIQPQPRPAWGEQYGPPAPPRRLLEPRTAPACRTAPHPQGELRTCLDGSWRLLRAIDGAVVEGQGSVVLPEK